MVEEKFLTFLELSAKLRPDYPKSLGKSMPNWKSKFAPTEGHVPEFFLVIYDIVAGTKRNIQDQSLMDFWPGYRLIHICEFKENYEVLKRVAIDNRLQIKGSLLPILSNYSSDFICFYQDDNKASGVVVNILHDQEEIVLMHNSVEKFLKTGCEFYKEGVYFLDNDGYLDYNPDLERKIGASFNPGISYWVD